MKMQYNDWIQKHYPDYESSKNKCNIAVAAMTRAFPELTVQVGYANDVYHCWTVDEAGNIIDPTIKQFNGVVEYRKIADRFLERDEYEPSTGAIFLKQNKEER